MRTSDICPTCSTFSNALCTLYNGALLPTLNINTLDSLETALIQIEAYTTALASQAGDYSEWASYTGTKIGDDLITILGDTTTITINEATQTISLNGSVDSVDNLVFDVAAPAPAEVPGQLHWNVIEDTLDLHANGVTYQLGQEIAPLVRNQTGVTITNGTPVMFAGTLGASGRVLITPAIADGSTPSSYVLGTTTEDILTGTDGHVTWFGKVRDIDTTGTPYGEVWADQDILYVSPVTAGYLTNVKPSAPNAQIFIGVVINAHATTGTYFVRPSWRGMITDLDDVNGTPLDTDGQILVWNQAAGYFDPTANINDLPLGFDYTAGVVTLGEAGDTYQVTFDFNEEGDIDLRGDNSTGILLASIDFYDDSGTNYTRVSRDTTTATDTSFGIPSVIGTAAMTGNIGVNDQVGTTYQVTGSDLVNGVRLNNASPVAVTFPTLAIDASFARKGREVLLINKGAGTVTVSGAGITFFSKNGLAILQNEAKTFKCTDTDEWTVISEVV